MEFLNSTALSQISTICRNVKSASCTLIHGKQLILDAAKNQRMQPRTKIHLVSEDGRQFLTIAEILEAHLFKHSWLKFCQHVHVALLRVKIIAQHRTKKTQLADAAF